MRKTEEGVMCPRQCRNCCIVPFQAASETLFQRVPTFGCSEQAGQWIKNATDDEKCVRNRNIVHKKNQIRNRRKSDGAEAKLFRPGTSDGAEKKEQEEKTWAVEPASLVDVLCSRLAELGAELMTMKEVSSIHQQGQHTRMGSRSHHTVSVFPKFP